MNNNNNDEESLELINRLLERLHQADFRFLGSIVLNIYFSYLLLWGCLAQSEMKKQKAKDQARLAWQQEVEQIDHQISELQAIISHSKENIMQLRSQRQDIIERHRKRRRRPWDDKTPMSRLVNLHEREAFNNLTELSQVNIHSSSD